MELAISRSIAAHSETVEAAIRSPEFYDRLGQLDLFETVTDNGHEIELVAPSRLPKLILTIFPKAPPTIGWSENLTHNGDHFVLETIPDVPDAWREHFAIRRTIDVTPNGDSCDVTETIQLDLELPKKWNRLVGIFEKRLTELLEARLTIIDALATE